MLGELLLSGEPLLPGVTFITRRSFIIRWRCAIKCPALFSRTTSVTEAPTLAARTSGDEFTLEQALAHHRAGRLARAEAIYGNILANDARHPDTLHLLGMIELQRGHHDVAVEMIRQAIARNQNEAAYHPDLGTVFQAQGKLDQARRML